MSSHPSSIADETGPTTTTKALLVTVVAPCHFSTKTASTAGDEEEDAEDSDGIEIELNEDPEADLTTTSKAGTQELFEEEKKTESGEEHSNKDNNDKDKTRLVEPDEEAIPLRDEIGHHDSQEITPDEAAAIKLGADPEDQQIHVEALLRICFQNLLQEYHLLNVPTYTYVEDKLLVTSTTDENDGSRNQENNKVPQVGEPQMTSWIRVEVMARPNSLGIILDRLERIGVGTHVGTLSVFKAELCRTASPYLNLPSSEKDDDSKEGEQDKTGQSNSEPNRGFDPNTSSVVSKQESDEDLEKVKEERMIEDAKAEWKNAATRLRIEQVREQIAEQASMSFDYISLLCIASILAGIGLITDNTVVIVASMLVSPIMGPVLGLTFGSRIRDVPLVIESFLNETLSLFGCIFIGMLVGLGAGFFPLAEETWPTNEMEGRGEAVGLIIGIAIAIPSGMGVCLSILGGNTSSLVGVAISASLLPPAVNAGICFMHAILIASGVVSCDSGKDAIDFAIIGSISVALTVLNIVCIWVAGMVMFEIKEVVPTASKGAFWDRDLKVARQLNQKAKKGEKPPPLDYSIINAGLKTALAKKGRTNNEDGQKIDAVKLRPPPQTRPRYDQANLNSAFSFKKRNTPTYERNENLWGAPAAGQDQEKNVKYVGWEDMAKFLGFDTDEDSVVIDNAAQIGRGGRYI